MNIAYMRVRVGNMMSALGSEYGRWAVALAEFEGKPALELQGVVMFHDGKNWIVGTVSKNLVMYDKGVPTDIPASICVEETTDPSVACRAFVKTWVAKTVEAMS